MNAGELRITWQVETNDRAGRRVDRRLILRTRMDGERSHWSLQRIGTDLWEIYRDDWPEGTYLAEDLPTAFDMADQWVRTRSDCEWCGDGIATTTRKAFVPDGVESLEAPPVQRVRRRARRGAGEAQDAGRTDHGP